MKIISKIKIYLITLFLLNGFVSVSHAKGFWGEVIDSINGSSASQKYAMSQFDTGIGTKLIVIQGFKSAECKKLIDTFEASIKLDCPSCTRDFAGCSEKLEEYQAVWRNEHFIFPYVSSGNMRMILLGVGRSYANDWCKRNEFKFLSIGKDARCIY